MKKFWKVILYLFIAGLVVFVLLQVVPYGRDHTNPSTISEPNWSSPEVRALVFDNCGQCHSHNTDWTWYSNIAPASWLIYWDVENARDKFNFSDWNNSPGYIGDLVEAINEGEMPPIQYTLFHPDAILDAQEKQALIDALTSSLEQ
jgi:mono/diheme cytochrome c family protein